MFKSLLPSAAAAFALLLMPATASAHTKLVSSTPAAKSAMLMLKRPLTAGTYKVTWSAAGADTHRMGSEFSFTVK